MSQPTPRDLFRKTVFARDRDRCVLCGDPGTEAHHVIDRKLFPDGGYVADNGALVCNPCHWDVETTKVSVEAVRKAAGIIRIVLPPGFAEGVPVDKWGNVLRDDGMRLAGPLAHDDGCRRALAKGGFLGLLLAPEAIP